MDKKNKIGIGLYLINLIVFAFLSFIIIKNNLLPSNIRVIYFVVMILMEVVLGYLLFKKAGSRKRKVLLGILTLMILLINGAAGYYANQSLAALGKINENQEEEQVGLSLVTLKDSDSNSPEDISEGQIIAPLDQDKESLELYGAKEYKNSKDYMAAVDDLMKGKGEALLINDAYMDLIKEKYPDFEERIKNIDSKEVTVKNKDIKKDVGENEPFTMYISGIDTYGSISTVSRTDVNLLVTVNPKTHKILITTIPRDSYVKIAGGGKNQYDKLTHSGIYGVGSSVATLENLFNTNINYYGRVNFSSLVKLVDVIGGIDVQNDEEFTSLHGGFHFPKGTVHLNGEQALGFARERYGLADGDMARGRNHEKILKAIIQKGMNPSILLNYTKVLDIMADSSETNMPTDKVIELVNSQIKTNSNWNIEGIQLQGVGKSGLPSYAMPGYDLYMFTPDEESVAQIKEKLNAALK